MKLLVVRVRAAVRAVSAARKAAAEIAALVVLSWAPREAVLVPVRITARRRRSPR